MCAALRSRPRHGHTTQSLTHGEPDTVVNDWTRPLEHSDEIEDGVKASDLYKAYRSWALDNGHRPLASNSFGERMKQAGFPSKHTRIGGFYPVKLARNF